MDRMNILVSVNDNYVMPQTVLLESLFENDPGPMTVWFMWSELSEKNRAFFRDYIESHGAHLQYVSVGEAEFKGLPRKDYISRETYFRLLAAEYLPESVEKILWLDADMIVTADIREFYDTDISAYAVAACPHGPAMRALMQENCARIGIRHPEQYFNAGVMLCNLKRWREMDVLGRIREVLSRPRDMKCPGQDLTNLIFNGEVLTEDWRVYNCMTHSILPEEAEELRGMARIVHFAGKAKPWDFSDLPFSDVWLAYYKRSPFAGQRLGQTSYFRMKEMCKKLNERTCERYFSFLESRFKAASDVRESITLSLYGYRVKLVFAGFSPDEVVRKNLSVVTEKAGSTEREDFDEVAYIWKDDLAPLVESSMIPRDKRGRRHHKAETYELMFPGDMGRLSARNKLTHSTYVVFAREEGFPVQYTRKPFINEIQWWVRERFFVLHSAFVGLNGKGALILGPSGAGKSTLALSCLQAGMDYVSEDQTLISRNGPVIGYPLFSTGNLTQPMLERLTAYQGSDIFYAAEKEKHLVELTKQAELFRDGLLVDLIVFPLLGEADEPAIRKAQTGAEFAQALATTADQMPFMDTFNDSFSVLFERLKMIPRFSFQLSSDPEKNAEALKEFVRTYHRE